MPHLLVSTSIRLENGPTTVGDSDSDPALMQLLGATPSKQLGNNFAEYQTPHVARIVLDKLEEEGWRVIGMCGVGQTCCWTLHKPSDMTPRIS